MVGVDRPPPAQTNVQLYEELRASGMVEAQLVRVRDACGLATRLVSGQYRASGKPFICHLVGTASILAAHGAGLETVLAGLLHSAYACGEFGDGLRGVTPAERAVVRAGVGPATESIVAAYRGLHWTTWGGARFVRARCRPPRGSRGAARYDNQSRELGTATATMEAVERQEFPLDRVEVVLVGSADQVRAWQSRAGDPRPFRRLVAVEAGEATYLGMKNDRARAATGSIIACTDSDVRPQPRWLASIVAAIGGGADVSVGPSPFDGPPPAGPHAPTRLGAASLTWGWTIGPRDAGGRPRVRGFMDHNVALRADVFAKHRYRT